ncbi:MAG TPA: SulP family inorganic anion transporter [Casimicrobiaceae bacterium]
MHSGTLPAWMGRLLPFLQWPRITAASARDDLLAGVTVSLVAIPQSLAYAQLAGVPAYYGLYAAFIPAIVGVLFGSSALLSTGPVAMTSLLTAASVTALRPAGLDQFYAYVTLLALLSGLFQLGFGLARAGMLISLVSHPVLMGFINAAALVIALSQLPALLGIPLRQSEHLLIDTWNVVSRMDLLHETSLAFGLGAMALLVLFKRWAPRLPGVLVTVALLTWVSHLIGFAERGGRIVGDIPTGLPGFVIPDMSWESTRALLPAALVVAVISFMEAMSSCKVIAVRTRAPWNENQELIGQGLAKIVAAFCGSMPVSGSFSRSALNLASNARTGLSSLFAAAAVLLTLLFFTSYLYPLPRPVLAAMIILAVVNLIDVGALKQAWLASREDGLAGTVTFVVTLAFAPNIQIGILTGIILSLGAYIYGRMRPRVAVVSLHPDGTLRDAGHYKLAPLHPKVGIVRFDASLYFANASFFEDAVLKLERETPNLQFIVIAATGINQLDASGVESLRNLSVRLRENGVTLVIGGIKRQVFDVMRRTGLVSVLRDENVFMAERAAIDNVLSRAETDSRAG